LRAGPLPSAETTSVDRAIERMTSANCKPPNDFVELFETRREGSRRSGIQFPRKSLAEILQLRRISFGRGGRIRDTRMGDQPSDHHEIPAVWGDPIRAVGNWIWPGVGLVVRADLSDGRNLGP
jgi:hypothetical protein